MRRKLYLVLIILASLMGTKAFADSRIDAMSSDPRITDDIDIIWMYPNKILSFKDTADFRLNSSSGYNNFGQGVGEWGGFTKDLKDLGLEGVMGVYLNRPFVPGTGVFPIEYWLPTGGTGFWQVTDAYLYRGADAPTTAAGVAAQGSANINILTPNNKIDLFWADNILNGVNVGVHLNYADNQPNSASNAVTTTVDNSLNVNNIDTSQVLGFDLGVGITSDFFNQCNGHFGYSTGSYTNSQVTNNAGVTTINNAATSNGISTTSAGVLLEHDFTTDNNVRFFGDWSSNQFAGSDLVQLSSTGNFNDPTATNYSGSNLYNLTVDTLGIAGNHKFNDGKSVFTTGVIANYWSSKQTSSESDKGNATSTNDYAGENDVDLLSVNWNAGVEAQVASWLVLRAGIEKFIYDHTTTKLTITKPSSPTTTVTTTGDSSIPAGGVEFSTGMGISIDKWSLNLVASAGSLEKSLQNFQPGNGIFFDNKSGTATGPIFTVVEADLSLPL